MTRTLFFAIFLLFCLAPAVFGATNEEPLTLLGPQQSGQTAPSPPTAQTNNDLRDIHGPLPLAEHPAYLLPLLGAIAFLLVLAAIIFLLKRRKNPVPPPIPPWDIALAELVKARQLMIPGQGLRYLETISQILRTYLESRFAIPSTRQTTREFLAGLSTGSSPLAMYQAELRLFLEQADMAKFAHLLPEHPHLARMEESLTAFINKTKPLPQNSGGNT